MPYIAINLSNACDPDSNTRSATAEEADARACSILNQFPAAQVFTAQVLKDYSAKVSITAKEPAEPETVPAPEKPAANSLQPPQARPVRVFYAWRGAWPDLPIPRPGARTRSGFRI